MRDSSQAALHEALALSHELVRVAQAGDAVKAQSLNSKRACLMRDFLDGAQPVANEDLQTMEQISNLNRMALQHLQASQRDIMLELATVTKGKLAVQAYGATRRGS
jgi:hypothetical protein